MISIKTNIAKFIATEMKNYKKQVQYATYRASQNTAFIVRDVLIDEMRKSFDKPTPWILRGVEVKKAFYQDRRTNQIAIVRLREEAGKGVPAVKSLWSEIMGGPRALKGYERLLNSKGILPDGYYIVPGKSAKLDQYGNIPGSVIVSILSELQAFGETGYVMNKRLKNEAKGKESKLRGYFVINKPGQLPMGIYQRKNGIIYLLMYFVQSQNYQKRYNFFDVGINAAKLIYPKQYDEALSNALRTAK